LSLATFAVAQLIRALPRKQLSGAMGRLAELPLPPPVSRVVMDGYSRLYAVNRAEAAPIDGEYASFDAFFTRELRPGARPIADARVVCPADGALASHGPVDQGSRLYAKGKPYEVGELIGSEADAARYRGGSFFVVYLSPRDYHRVHAPVDGELSLVRGIPGDLYPVNSVGERHVPRLFSRNNRVSIVIDTAALGRVTVVMVGATIVGRISVTGIDAPAVPPGEQHLSPPLAVRRGDEIGVFHLGSTAVVLLEPGVSLDCAVGPVLLGAAFEKRA
jgi:phosphatidylserine decarboxylase